MIGRAVVRRSHYRDSMALMRLAEALRALPGVRQAAALMGTPANHEILASAGLATVETKDAAPGDLIIAVMAESDAAADAALAEVERILTEQRPSLGGEGVNCREGMLRQQGLCPAYALPVVWYSALRRHHPVARRHRSPEHRRHDGYRFAACSRADHRSSQERQATSAPATR